MEPIAMGQAVIRHSDTNEVFTFTPEDLTWDIVGFDEQQMGNVIQHQAAIYHDDLGDIIWNVWEYPSGVLNYYDHQIEDHDLLEDFKFDFIDIDESEFHLLTSEELASLPPANQQQYLAAWFHYYYWDPANDLPYETAEGGYQWIYGGPYHASEVLEEEFADFIDAQLIQLAVYDIERNGQIEWSPSPNHPAQERDDDYTHNNDDLIDVLANLPTSPVIIAADQEKERIARDAFKAAVQEVVKELGEESGSRLKIGGNNPPDEFKLTADEWNGVLNGVTRVNDALEVGDPNPVTIAHSLVELRGRWDDIKRRAGLFMDEVAKSAGKSVGEWLGPKGVALGCFAFGTLSEKISSLFSSAIEWLQTFNLPF